MQSETHTKSLVRLALMFSCALLGLVSIAKAFALESVHDGYISRIVDGDTVHFKNDSDNEADEALKIRMIGIDAPELHFPDGSGKMRAQNPWGQDATDFLQSLIPPQSAVRLQDLGRDKYKRVLGRLFYKGKDVNLKMVREGMAFPYIICEGKNCDEKYFEKEHVSEYFEACKIARKEKKGIYDPNNPLAELPFEFRMRLSKQDPSKIIGDFETRKLYPPAAYKKVDLCQRVFFLKMEDAVRAGYSKD